ncbi:hypothetical protein [Nocardioides aurantiacus]|uniref:Uncharacterized protein n=1 Tax=Nocardioides aurantiacus TaxID=86796 RepID=A0A3N2CYE3_9ACTN|nr:hypothetical protein [Nocardioides aurantiacus]ROR92552.1 hypothetical protein EDD33_3443 [Nocardioides aurantiacus]
MTQGPDDAGTDGFVGGEQARAQVEADPFWSVVRRRHPDVTLAVLPPADGAVPPLPEGTAPVDPAEAAARQDADVLDRWRELVGPAVGAEDAGTPASPEARWTAGEVQGTRRRETTLRDAGVDDVRAVGVLLRAEDALRTEGWHVLAPTGGVPRVLAGRPAELGREELQLLAPPGRGVVLRVRGASVLLGEVPS